MICKHPGNPLLHKGIVGMRFLLFWGSSFSLQRIKSSMEVFSPKGSRGRAESPLVASADAKSPAMKKASTGIVSRCWSVAPIWREMCKWSNEQLGGASADARSYWQGRFAACAFLAFPLELVARETVGALPPNPTRELRPLTPQGTLSLDPFSASRLERASLTLPLPAFFLPLPLVYAPKPSTASPTAQSRRPSRPATNTTPRESRKSATA